MSAIKNNLVVVKSKKRRIFRRRYGIMSADLCDAGLGLPEMIG